MGCCNGRTGGAELTPAQELPEEEIVIHQQENDNPFSNKSAQTLTNEFLLQGKSGRLTFTQLELACRNIGIQVNLLTSSESQFTSFSNELRDDDGNFITKKLYLSSLLMGQGSLTEKIKLLSKYFELDESGSITENNAKQLIEDLIEVAVVVSPHLAEGEGKLTEDEIKRFSQELNKNKSGLVKKLASKIMGSEEHINNKQFIDKFFKNEDLQQLLTTTGIRSMLRDENVRVISVRDEVKSSFDFSKAKKSLQEPYTTKGNPEIEEEKIIENTTIDTNRTNNKSSEASLSARSSHFNAESETAEEKSTGKHKKKSSIKDKDSIQPTKRETKRKEESSSVNKDRETIEPKKDEKDYKQTITSQSLDEDDKNEIILEKYHKKDQEKSEREKDFKIINDTYRNLGEKSPRTESEITEKSLTDIKIVDLKLSPIIDNYEEEEEEESSNDIKIDYNQKIVPRDNRKTHNVSLEIKAPFHIESQTSDEAINSSSIVSEERKAETENIEKEIKIPIKDFEEQNISGFGSESHFKKNKTSNESINSSGIINEERKVAAESIEKEKSMYTQDFGGQNISEFDFESDLQKDDPKGIENEQKRSTQNFIEAQNTYGFSSKITPKRDDAEIIEETKEGNSKDIQKIQNISNSGLETELKANEIENIDMRGNGAQIQDTLDFKIEPKEGDIQHIKEDKRLNTEIVENSSISNQDYLKNIAGEEKIATQSISDSQNYFASGSDIKINVENMQKINNENVSSTQYISIVGSEQDDFKNSQTKDEMFSTSNSKAQIISPHHIEVGKGNSEEIRDTEIITEIADSKLNDIKNYEEEKNIISGNIKSIKEENTLSDTHNLSMDIEQSNKANEDIYIAKNRPAFNSGVIDSNISEEEIIDSKLVVGAKNDSEFNKDLEAIRNEIKNIEEEKKVDSNEILELQSATSPISSAAGSRKTGIQDIEDLEKNNLKATKEENTEDIGEIKNVFEPSSGADSIESDFKNIREGEKDKTEEIHSRVKSISEPNLGIDSTINVKDIEEEKSDLVKEIHEVHNDSAFDASPEPKRNDIKNTEEEVKYAGEDNKIQDSSIIKTDVDSKIDSLNITEEEKKDAIGVSKTDPIEEVKMSTIEEGTSSAIEESKTEAIRKVEMNAFGKVKDEAMQEMKIDAVGGVNIDFIEEVKTGNEEGEMGAAEEGKIDSIEKVNSDAIEDEITKIIHPVKNDSIEEVETDFIETAKVGAIEEGENDIIEGEIDSIEKLEAVTIEEIKPEVTEEVKMAVAEEVEKGDIDEVKIDVIEVEKNNPIEEMVTETVKEMKNDTYQVGKAETIVVVEKGNIEEVKTDFIETEKISAIKEEGKNSIIEERKTNTGGEVKAEDIKEESTYTNEELETNIIEEMKTVAIEDGNTNANEGVIKGDIDKVKTDVFVKGENNSNEEMKTEAIEEGKTSTYEEEKVKTIDGMKNDNIEEVKTDFEDKKTSVLEESKVNTSEGVKTKATEEEKTYTNKEGKTYTNEEVKTDTIEEGNSAEEMKMGDIEDSRKFQNSSDIGASENKNEIKNIEEIEKSEIKDESKTNIFEQSPEIRQIDTKNAEEDAKISLESQNTSGPNLKLENMIKNIEIEGEIFGEEVSEAQYVLDAKSNNSNLKIFEEKTNIEGISSLIVDENTSELNLDSNKQGDSKNIKKEENIDIRGKSLDQNTLELDARNGSRIPNITNLEIEENKNINKEDVDQIKLNQSIESKQESIKILEEEEKISTNYSRKEDMEQKLYKKDFIENKVEAFAMEEKETAVEIQVEPVIISLNPESKEGSIIDSSDPYLKKNFEAEKEQKENEKSNIINIEKESSSISSNDISLQPQRNIYTSEVGKDEVSQAEIIDKIESQAPARSSNEEANELLSQIEAKNLKNDSSCSTEQATDKNSTEQYENNEIANKIAPSALTHESESKIIKENFSLSEKTRAKDISVPQMTENASSSIESPKLTTNFDSDMANQAKLESSPSRGSIGMDEDKERVSLFPYQYLGLVKSEENIPELPESSIPEPPKNVQEVAKLADSEKREKEKKPVVIQMNLGPGKVEKFEVRPGDDPVQMAYDFANSHQFTQRERLKLVKTMTELKAKLNY